MMVARHRIGAVAAGSIVAWTFLTGLPLAPAAASISASTTSIALVGPEVVRDVVEPLSVGIADVAAAGVEAAALAPEGWEAEIALSGDVELIGFVWDGAPDAELEVRSDSGGGWTEWVEIGAVPDEGPDAPEDRGVSSAGPVWIGRGTTAVQVRVVHGELPSLRLQAIDVDATEGFGIASAGAAAPFPSIEPRSVWGSPGWRYDIPGCESGPGQARPRYAILHHTVTTNAYSAADSASLIRGIYEFHTNTNQWCDIAYNFFVDRFGRIIEGRSGGMDRGIVGGHARGFNTGSIGVALLGQHHPGAEPASAGVSAAARTAVQRLLSWKFALHGIDALATTMVTSRCTGACRHPDGTVLHLPTIVGHRDVGLTSCPGDFAIGLTTALRSPVAHDVITAGPWHPMGGWVPSAGSPRVLTLDALGGLHPAGGAATVSGGGYWGYAVARGVTGTATRGYVVDGWGGIHAFGGAAPVRPTGYWAGWDIVRGIASGSNAGSGYVLSGWGSLHPFGGALPVAGSAYWAGWDIARDVAVLPTGLGGYVLSGWGSIHPFGVAPPATGSAYWRGWDIARSIALNPAGPGGWVLSGWGSVHAFGGAPAVSGTYYTPGADTARDLVMTSSTGGYVVDRFGGVHVVGNAAAVQPSLTWTGFDIARGIVAG